MIEKIREQLNDMEKSILQITYDTLKETGDWPNALELAVRLRKEGDLFKVGNKLGHMIVRLPHYSHPTEPCKLTVLGVALCENSESDIGLFMNTLELSVKRFIEDPKEAKLTAEDIKKTFSVDDDQLIRLKMVLRETSRPWSGFSMRGDEPLSFELHINYDVLVFENTKKFEDYMKIIKDQIPTHFGGTYERTDNYVQNPSLVLPAFNYGYEAGGVKESQKDKVFILMAMSEDYELSQVNKNIKEVCAEFGLNPMRVDDFHTSGNINEEILHNIQTAEFLIVDLTKERPNVYYELGYAHGIGFGAYDLILLAQEGTNVHFDIRNLRIIYYNDPDDMKEKLITRFKSLFDVR